MDKGLRQKGSSTAAKSRDAGSSHGHRPELAAAVIVAVGGIIAAVVAGAFGLLGRPSATPGITGPRTPAVQTTTPDGPAHTSSIVSIRDPQRGSIVPLCASASGLSAGMPKGRNLWLFVQIPDTNDRPGRYYLVAGLRPTRMGNWSTRFTLGDPGEGRRPYWLEVVSSDPSVTGPINVKAMENDALTSIPPGFDSRPLATVKVWSAGVNASTGGTCG
jgi:hypothetical protein